MKLALLLLAAVLTVTGCGIGNYDLNIPPPQSLGGTPSWPKVHDMLVFTVEGHGTVSIVYGHDGDSHEVTSAIVPWTSSMPFSFTGTDYDWYLRVQLHGKGSIRIAIWAYRYTYRKSRWASKWNMGMIANADTHTKNGYVHTDWNGLMIVQ